MLGKGKTLGKPIKIGKGGIPETMGLICKQFHESLKSEKAKQLAFSLKGESMPKTCENIRNWIKANIQYVSDPDGKEWVKSADATLRDKTGDCEDMTILAGAMLWHLYPEMRGDIHSNVVAMDNEYYSHIFLTVGNNATHSAHVKGISLDVVPPLEGDSDNTDEINITRNFRLSLKDMDLYAINGVNPNIAGIGAISGAMGHIAPTEYTKCLQANQSRLVNIAGIGAATPDTAAALRVTHALIKLNGTPEAEIIAPLVSLIKDVTPNGSWVWHDYAPLESIAAYFENVKSAMEMDNEGISGIGVLKNPIKNLIQKATATIKNTAAIIKASPVAIAANKTKVGQMIKTAAAAVKTGVQNFVKNPIQTIAHFFPVTVVMRNGLLLAMRFNLRGMATKYAYYYMSENEAASKGINATDLAELKSKLKKSIDFFVKAGGVEANLKAAIEKGKSKKPLFGMKKAVNGIGAGGALLAITTALAPIGEFLKALGPVLNIFKKSKDENAKVDSGTENDLKADAFNDAMFDEDPNDANVAPVSLLTPQADGYRDENEQQIAYQTMTDERLTANEKPANVNDNDNPKDMGTTNYFWIGLGVFTVIGVVAFTMK